MSREWKPGDVIAGRVRGCPSHVFFVVEATANSTAAWGDGLHAINEDGNGYRVDDIAEARPLVVIDPESLVAGSGTDAGDEIVEIVNCLRRIAESDGSRTWRARLCLSLADVFAGQDHQTKPDEPTGLGAVVEDAKGTRWVRKSNDPSQSSEDSPFAVWNRSEHLAGTAPECYHRIAAVKVLSEGVTA